MNYAIVHTGGKQYRVSPGDTIHVEKLPVEEGSTVELSDVLLLSQDGTVIVGSPGVKGAKVVGEVERHGRGEKIAVFRFKSKTRQRTKTGHRQGFTRVRITDIVTERAPRARRRPSKKPTEESSDGA